MAQVMKLSVRLISVMLVSPVIACAPSSAVERTAASHSDIAQLWQEPADLPTRDLFYGSGGAALAPPAQNGRFHFIAPKINGTNPGYEVRDDTGRVWSVKIGVEAQPEVTASRILWAIGYPQPPQYFVHQFAMTGGGEGVVTRTRFRTDAPGWRSIADWSWYDNPFVDSQPFRGLIVAQLILNNWDLKTINNRIYDASDAASTPNRQYMVRDLGASLGYAKQFPLLTLLGTPGAQGTKNDIDGFESQGFITGTAGNKMMFDYRGPHQALVDRVSPADVIWVCERLARISDAQWQNAFKAGAYPQLEANRYISKIKSKIAQGLALKTPRR